MEFMLPPASQSNIPWHDGILPVTMDALAGEQTGDAQKKLVKRTPFSASASMLGVTMSGFPAQCIAHAPWSSDKIKTMFGFMAPRLIKNFAANFCLPI